MLYTSSTAMAVFNVTHGLKSLGSECTAGRLDVYRTQYRELFLYLGDEHPHIETVKADVDLEQLTEVTQDSLQRLMYRVDDVVRVSDQMAQCRSQTRGGQENLVPTLTVQSCGCQSSWNGKQVLQCA